MPFSSPYSYAANNPVVLVDVYDHGGGKNDQHKNPKARSSAEQKYKEVKEAWEKLKSKPNKSKEETKAIENLKKQVQHWKKKMDDGGENHSQSGKGY